MRIYQARSLNIVNFCIHLLGEVCGQRADHIQSIQEFEVDSDDEDGWKKVVGPKKEMYIPEGVDWDDDDKYPQPRG